ncbi:MAG: SEC-C metal-binding domain-containing protein, partial [Actinomycetota bacterium]
VPASLGGGAPVAAVDAVQKAASAPKAPASVEDAWYKTPRNAPCPCGSGKKYKMCHGAN